MIKVIFLHVHVKICANLTLRKQQDQTITLIKSVWRLIL